MNKLLIDFKAMQARYQNTPTEEYNPVLRALDMAMLVGYRNGHLWHDEERKMYHAAMREIQQ